MVDTMNCLMPPTGFVTYCQQRRLSAGNEPLPRAAPVPMSHKDYKLWTDYARAEYLRWQQCEEIIE
jgi:hypothetical protein